MKTNDSNQETQVRLIRNAPFAWQHKTILKMINDAFSDADRCVSARSVYLALTELASDHGVETFTETKALIAHKAMVSVKTVERILKGFEELGIVKVERAFASSNSGTIQAPNTYTLVALRLDDVATLRLGGTHSKSEKVEQRKESKEREARMRNTKCASSTCDNSIPAEDDGGGWKFNPKTGEYE